jgi:hypothetical protein
MRRHLKLNVRVSNTSSLPVVRPKVECKTVDAGIMRERNVVRPARSRVRVRVPNHHVGDDELGASRRWSGADHLWCFERERVLGNIGWGCGDGGHNGQQNGDRVHDDDVKNEQLTCTQVWLTPTRLETLTGGFICILLQGSSIHVSQRNCLAD